MTAMPTTSPRHILTLILTSLPKRPCRHLHLRNNTAA